MKRFFLPVGTFIAVLLAFYLPEAGMWLRAHFAVYGLVGLIFLISGWCFVSGEIALGRRAGGLLGAAALLSLFLGPLLAVTAGKLFGLTGDSALGLIVTGAMPTTLSSAIVITGLCGGKRAWAVFFTVGLNLAAIITVPFLLPHLMEIETGVEIDSFNLLWKMLLLVLLPFAVGLGAGRLCRLPSVINGYVPSLCVIAIVYIGFCASNGFLRAFNLALLPKILLAVFLLHLALLALSTFAGWLLRLSAGETIAFALCIAQKTLPMAVSILAAIGQDTGLTLIPCLAYSFLQIIFDPFVVHHLPRRYANSSEPITE